MSINCTAISQDCNDLEMTNMTWACPRCRDQQINASNGDAGDDVEEQLFEALHVENQEEASKHEEKHDRVFDKVLYHVVVFLFNNNNFEFNNLFLLLPILIY